MNQSSTSNKWGTGYAYSPNPSEEGMPQIPFPPTAEPGPENISIPGDYLASILAQNRAMAKQSNQLATMMRQFMQQRPPPVAATNAPASTRVAKIAEPDKFSGKLEQLDIFIRQIKMHLVTRPNKFPNMETKIAFAISYMKKGTPAQWAQSVWTQIQTNLVLFPDWPTFATELRTIFGDSDPHATAWGKIEKCKQGGQTAEEYAIEFRDLANRTGFNKAAHIDIFKQGLNVKLLEKLYSMPTMPNTLDKWYKMAIQIDRNWRNFLADTRGRSTMTRTNNTATSAPSSSTSSTTT